MISVVDLFKKFLVLGAVAYGGPAMMGLIKQAVVGEKKWLKEAEFLQGMALCQVIPGATMVQMATYVGYRLRGFWGALASAVAFVLPAFLFLLVLSFLYFETQSVPFAQALFKFLGTIVVAIVLTGGVNLGRSILRDWKTGLISALSFAAFLLNLNILLIFSLAAVAALLLRPQTAPVKGGPPPGDIGAEKAKKKDPLLLALLAGLIVAGLTAAHFVDPRIPLLTLVLSKIGALAFGGGFTMIPLIQHEVVEQLHWLDIKQFLDGILLGQVTPGPIMITATFIGYKVAGLLGALAATVGIFAPSFFILVSLVPYHDKVRKINAVRTIEQGILASFIGLLGLVLYNFGKASLVDVPSVLFAAAAFVALYRKIGLPYILAAGGVIFVLLYTLTPLFRT